ncbi:cathepsin L1-like [Leptonychotes weddellii]|uniref:Procathepsin L n=1 Tax=Leptonychotes weddellii TaxID=9713 RepID=A0A7F8RRL1_LEPWE|nr:cathepsin L1-like [Leptonychotes weddellii]
MHPSLLLAALCLGTTTAAPEADQSLDAHWSRWKAAHGKLYDENEEGWRRAVWAKNMQMIERHNQEYSQGKHSFTMAMNAFGDLVRVAWIAECFMRPVLSTLPKNLLLSESFIIWFQGQCASGWAFSAAGALEGQMFRKTGKLVSLSEQNLLDCSRSQGNEGCRGGLMDYAFQYVKDNGGLDSEESYPYCAQDGSCKYKPGQSVANDTGFMDIRQDEGSLMVAVATVGPISAAIVASLDTFQFYHKGIYYDPNCSSEDLDHGILVVGYGFQGEEPENQKYWIVKNSWGTDWGMQGYILMAKDRDNHCGIATSASFPIV